ncbi:tetratricopeptide repeat protein [Hyalangium versicolor]|uniref:tetratricopeptide repeat protein n=1 Tax=Hyalangium versicolor TaxID=2861190 RepID=UPI001CCB8E7A|nr:tetratricopeptide repeat protein [Hyalangium versicolor]
MKRWNFVALGLAVLLGTAAVAKAPAGKGATKAEAGGNPRALAVYEEGKRLYDAKKYAAALQKFDQAAELEPDKARWQYNRGLALRKLNRFPEAREALLKSRALDPEYKRAEINDKLREMGFSPEDSTPTTPSTPATEPPAAVDAPTQGADTAPPLPPAPVTQEASSQRREGQGSGGLCCAVGGGAALVGLVMLFRRFRRSKESRGEEQGNAQSARRATPEDLQSLEALLEKAAASLIPVEHALRLGEDPDLRAMLNQATMSEQRAREGLERARSTRILPPSLDGQCREAEERAYAALERAKSLYGDKAVLEEGERVGCYFCARPLANPAFRQQVPIKRGSEVVHVLACPPCANMASAGQSPPVKVVIDQNGQRVHWSELEDYSPYVHRHRPYQGARLVQPWEYTPQRSMGEVAAMAAGGALAAGAVAYGVSRLLDLDNAQEAAEAEEAAQAAAQAAARRASERREERDWKDHS